jgi:hypothetical protein
VICSADYFEDIVSILRERLRREPTVEEIDAELARRRREGQGSPLPSKRKPR